MKIRHNIPAMNAYRNYKANTKSLQGNLQKLSSGYKINKAGDDAAGLAISEKMRVQITGLEVAQKNAKDGISLVQTAEGAMTEIHTMLNRMFSLAEQSANGTYDDEVDRKQLDNEFQKLTAEIDRIADATNFNGIKLLNGNLGGSGLNPNNNCFHVKVSGSAAYTAKDSIFTGIPDWDFNSVVQTFRGDIEDYENYFDDELYKPVGLDGKSINIQFSNTHGNSLSTNDTVTISGIPAGYKIFAANGAFTGAGGSQPAFIEVTNNTSFTFGNATGQLELPTAGNTWTLLIEDNAGHRVADLDLKMAAGLKSTGTVSTIKFSTEPQITEFNIDSNDNMEKFNFDAVNLSALKNLKDGEEVKAKYQGGVLTVTVGEKEFTFNAGTSGIKAEDLADTDPEAGIKLTSADGETIEIFFGEDKTKQVIGNDKIANANDISEMVIGKTTIGSSSKGKLRFRVGDSTEEYDNIYVSIRSMKAADLKGKTCKLEDLNVLHDSDADTAMDELKEMINYVSTERGNLGATQNRLDHTINNLSTMQENIQDAEATIRDVDVAEEMMKYTKNNILIQSAQAMLAQANQLPQGVLQLFG